MSLKAILWAFERRCGSSSAKLVLIKLADNANDNGLCWPSVAYIAQHTELSRTAVRENVKKLVELGAVTIIPRFRDGVQLPNAYQLNFGEGLGADIRDENVWIATDEVPVKAH